jgi:hypothetical protein
LTDSLIVPRCSSGGLFARLALGVLGGVLGQLGPRRAAAAAGARRLRRLAPRLLRRRNERPRARRSSRRLVVLLAGALLAGCASITGNPIIVRAEQTEVIAFAGGAATTPVTALSTGSAEPRSAAVSDPASVAVAFSAERSDDACVAFAVTTENETAAEACSRCLPEGAALPTAVIAMAEAGAASAAASVAVSVLFCAAPKLPADTPASVTLEANVVCVVLANPGGLTVHATAPAAGEYDPGEHVWHC